MRPEVLKMAGMKEIDSMIVSIGTLIHALWEKETFIY